MDLKWPFSLAYFMDFTGGFGNFSSQFLSLECFIFDYNLNINIIYLRVFVNSSIYVIFLIFSVLICIIRRFCYNQKKEQENFIIIFVVLSILLQPNSINDSSDIFNCQKIQTDFYLSKSVSTMCYTSNHKKWVIF